MNTIYINLLSNGIPYKFNNKNVVTAISIYI